MIHQPVLLEDTIGCLLGDPNGLYIDCTLGGGGHLRALIPRLGAQARVIAIDRDPNILELSRQQLQDGRIRFVHADFRELSNTVDPSDWGQVEGIMIDLGVSSFQLDNAHRGFSFHQDADLDMRMDTTANLKAWDIVNLYPEDELAQIIYRWGEERYARRIAGAIAKARSMKTIDTTLELVEIIKQAVPAHYRREKHPARRTFQAIRMAVNDELGAIEEVLPQAVAALKPGGKLAVITFHSLEDRLVKRFFTAKCQDCICPPRQPVCTCGGNRAELRLMNRRPITASEEECLNNHRARSAKLRVAQKI